MSAAGDGSRTALDKAREFGHGEESWMSIMTRSVEAMELKVESLTADLALADAKSRIDAQTMARMDEELRVLRVVAGREARVERMFGITLRFLNEAAGIMHPEGRPALTDEETDRLSRREI